MNADDRLNAIADATKNTVGWTNGFPTVAYALLERINCGSWSVPDEVADFVGGLVAEIARLTAELDAISLTDRDTQNDEIERLRGHVATLTAENERLKSDTEAWVSQIEWLRGDNEKKDAAIAEFERLTKRHADIVGELYGKGFEVIGWHMNGATEPLDSWFEWNDWLDAKGGDA